MIVFTAAYASAFAYLVKLTALSPVYVLIPLMLPAMIALAGLKQARLTPAGVTLLAMSCLVPIAMVSQAKAATSINLLLGTFSYLAFYAFTRSPRFNIRQHAAAVNVASFLVLLMISIDTLWRLSHPGAPNETMQAALLDQDLGFYLYKFNTMMFADSNTVAIALQCIFFTNLFLLSVRLGKKTILVLAYALILATLSRSAIIATTGFIIFYAFGLFRPERLMPLLLLAFASSLIAMYLDGGSAFSFVDQSLSTKTYIVRRFVDYTTEAPTLILLFGSGFDQSAAVLGIYGHIFFVTLLVEFGVIGGLLYVFFFIASATSSRGRTLIVILPLMISGLSYWFYLGAPFIFASIGIVEGLGRRLDGSSDERSLCDTSETVPQYRSHMQKMSAFI